jgi:SAM-dependent methyltransferase
MNQTEKQDEYFHSAQFYDYIEVYQKRPDQDFYVHAAREYGGPVLELGCGTGRILIPTARAGMEITGLDGSPAMLKICREKLVKETAEVQSRVILVEKDLRDFDLGRRFSLVTIPFRPFQHLLTVGDQLACLSCIHRHLKSDGVFILDVFNPWLEAIIEDNIGKEFGSDEVKDLPDGRRVVRRNRMIAKDRARQLIQSELVYYVTHPDGREERLVQPLIMRYLFRYEAEHLLARSGFTVEHVYGDYDKSPFGEKYPGELILVSRKKQ